MSAGDNLSPQQFTLYRGEGNHNEPSPYYNVGPNKSHAGGWWTDNVSKARNYAAGRPDGQVYAIDVDSTEAAPRGARGNYFIEDPQVRARRRLHTED